MKYKLTHLEMHNGIIMCGHSKPGRYSKFIDLLLRLKFTAKYLPVELKLQRRPFRFIKSLRAALTMAWTFDRYMPQESADASIPTTNVGNDGDNNDSPLSGDTSTLCSSPQSGQRIDESSSDNDRHKFSI